VKPSPAGDADFVKVFGRNANQIRAVADNLNRLDEKIICEALKNKSCEANHISAQ
jgi:hypothetical protein